jgi:hypothetical protein
MQHSIPLNPLLAATRQTIRQHNVSPEDDSVKHLLAINPLSEDDQEVEIALASAA